MNEEIKEVEFKSPNDSLKEFGENLKNLRMKNKMNQTDFGSRINISPQQISDYEKGKKSPQLETIMRIAREYGCSLDELCFGKNSQKIEITTFDDAFDCLIELEDFITYEIKYFVKEHINNYYDDSYETLMPYVLFNNELFIKYFEKIKEIKKLYDSESIDYDIYAITRKGIIDRILENFYSNIVK